MLVRERADADLPACVQLARAVHERDGYPHYLPGDLAGLPGPAATRTGRGWPSGTARIVGHVALRRRTAPAPMELASAATGLSWVLSGPRWETK